MELLKKTFIKDIMVSNVTTLRVDSAFSEAHDKMHTHHIRHLPVVDHEGHLMGIFSERDFLKAYHPRQTDDGWYYSEAEMNRLSLKRFMTADPTTLSPEDSLYDAAGLMARHKYGCIPIVTGPKKRLVGILTPIDVLRFCVKIS